MGGGIVVSLERWVGGLVSVVLFLLKGVLLLFK